MNGSLRKRKEVDHKHNLVFVVYDQTLINSLVFKLKSCFTLRWSPRWISRFLRPENRRLTNMALTLNVIVMLIQPLNLKLDSGSVLSRAQRAWHCKEPHLIFTSRRSLIRDPEKLLHSFLSLPMLLPATSPRDAVPAGLPKTTPTTVVHQSRWDRTFHHQTNHPVACHGTHLVVYDVFFLYPLPHTSTCPLVTN